jgi:hypothetical protein
MDYLRALYAPPDAPRVDDGGAVPPVPAEEAALLLLLGVAAVGAALFLFAHAAAGLFQFIRWGAVVWFWITLYNIFLEYTTSSVRVARLVFFVGNYTLPYLA